jgi:hypothetical protein
MRAEGMLISAYNSVDYADKELNTEFTRVAMLLLLAIKRVAIMQPSGREIRRVSALFMRWNSETERFDFSKERGLVNTQFTSSFCPIPVTAPKCVHQKCGFHMLKRVYFIISLKTRGILAYVLG